MILFVINLLIKYLNYNNIQFINFVISVMLSICIELIYISFKYDDDDFICCSSVKIPFKYILFDDNFIKEVLIKL